MKQLTPFEALVLEKLKGKEGELVDRGELGAIEAPKPKLDSNRIDVHIKNLRKKLPRGYEIQTLRGRGYKLIRTKH